jgi:hypothetical protein
MTICAEALAIATSGSLGGFGFDRWFICQARQRRSVITDGFYWTTFFCLFREASFLLGHGLMKDDTVSIVLVASKDAGSGFATKVTIDAV